tara:strand:+ start:268786 stop:270048 length:1263 start_codon:yes stop_codon:yes gene_type:complete
MKIYDLIGIGIGPFNLSLAALLPQVECDALFLDDKEKFSWHQELMFEDASMQTSYLKDLVTPVDPTSQFSFLNYLNDVGQFYHFLNTDRKTITRIEFEAYCKWVADKLENRLEFNSKVKEVNYTHGNFEIITENKTFYANKLCVASGPKKNIPPCAKPFLGKKIFHAKSKEMLNLDLTDKKVLIVGGGQTGIEILRNGIKSKWGKAHSITLISGRDNLRPLDEGPFTNEVFTPNFVENFYELDQVTKDDFTKNLLLASDGNTPEYLQELYNELYLEKFYKDQMPEVKISPSRWLEDINPKGDGYELCIRNLLSHQIELLDADIVIMATGFTREIPSYLNNIKDYFKYDENNRIIIKRDYRLETKIPNTIYAMNFSMHMHGIADPQTSLMSWRSAIIANNLMEKEIYKVHQPRATFLNFFN